MNLYYNSLAKTFSLLSGWISSNIRMVLVGIFSFPGTHSSPENVYVSVTVPFKSRTKLIYSWALGQGLTRGTNEEEVRRVRGPPGERRLERSSQRSSFMLTESLLPLSLVGDSGGQRCFLILENTESAFWISYLL